MAREQKKAFGLSLSVTILLLALALFLPAELVAQGRLEVVAGHPVTGLNRLLGQPVTDFGPPAGLFGFTTVAAHNPGAAEPLPLTPDSPLDTILATAVDPAFLDAFGVPPESVDTSRLNIPLREVPALVAPDGVTFAPLPRHRQVGPLTPNQAEPAGAPITLEDWLAAEGVAVLECRPNGTGTVVLFMSGLIPNRIFTVWAIFDSPQGPRPVPMGGAPNTFVTNGRGLATFRRFLSFCPFETTVDGATLLTLEIVLHSDHQVYASEPTPFFAGLPPGLVAHPQLEFVVLGAGE